jgi:hypothetical protein
MEREKTAAASPAAAINDALHDLWVYLGFLFRVGVCNEDLSSGGKSQERAESSLLCF